MASNPASQQNGVTKMFNLPVSFISGAAFIKKNQQQFKNECLTMAGVQAIHESVKAELIAAANAKPGACNTGLNETGWRAFAEVIGMTSPKSSKLIIPTGVSPEYHKHECMAYWLITGVYSSSRVDGKGGSKAIKDEIDLFARGLLAKGRKVRPVPSLETTLFDVSGDI